MNVVIDTNVLVSAALFPRSIPRRAVSLAGRHGRLLLSDATTDELDEVMRRPRLDKFADFESRMEFLATIILLGEEVEIVERIAACRDVKDDKFLELAASGRATHLVTGDADLLALHPFRGIPVLSPADFVALFDPAGS